MNVRLSTFTTRSTSVSSTTSTDISFSTFRDIIPKSNPRTPHPGCVVTFLSVCECVCVVVYSSVQVVIQLKVQLLLLR